jgi:hypothetical protein
VCDEVNIVRTRAHGFDSTPPADGLVVVHMSSPYSYQDYMTNHEGHIKAKVVYQWVRDWSGARNRSIKAKGVSVEITQ